MEFDLHDDGTLTPLPRQNIDTGLGVERGAAILQEVDSVYETDSFAAIMAWVARETGTRYGESDESTKAHRVLADHGAGDGVPRRRRRHAFERGTGLRHAPDRAPGRPTRVPDRPRGAVSRTARRRRGRSHERLLPVPRGESRRDPPDPLRGRGALCDDTHDRDAAVRRGAGAKPRGDLGRGRVPAPRHVRVSARADPGARARARSSRRRGPVRAPHGRPA